MKPPRPFEADYPCGARLNDAGNLAVDIEGRPLTAPVIVGRQAPYAPDRPLAADEVRAVGEGSFGARYSEVPAASIGGDAGRLNMGRNPETGVPEYRVLARRGLTPEQTGRVVSHETAHLLDELAGQIPTSGPNTELGRLYNILNTGQERTRHLTGPENLKYKGDEIPRELMIEAIRAYMADPNYIKTVAPKTAAAIRKAVNEHPRLRDYALQAKTQLQDKMVAQSEKVALQSRALRRRHVRHRMAVSEVSCRRRSQISTRQADVFTASTCLAQAIAGAMRR